MKNLYLFPLAFFLLTGCAYSDRGPEEWGFMNGCTLLGVGSLFPEWRNYCSCNFKQQYKHGKSEDEAAEICLRD